MHELKEIETVTVFTIPNGYSGIDTTYRIVFERTIIPVLVQVSPWLPELFGKGIMTTMLCYNNRPPTLCLIPVIYNSLGQNNFGIAKKGGVRRVRSPLNPPLS